MLFVALLLASAPAQTPVGRGIHAFCREQPACIARQQQAAKHFLGVTVMYDAPQAVAERCMRSGKAGGSIDWTIAESCMRRWSRGRTSVVAQGMKAR